MIFITEVPIEMTFKPLETDNVYIICRQVNGTYQYYCVVDCLGGSIQCDDCKSLLENDLSEIIIRHPKGSEMSIHVQNGLYSVGIVDEEQGIIYYYDNKNGQEGSAELHGKTFPLHMISKSKDTVYMMIEYFIQTGLPFKAMNWIDEEF